MAIAEAVDVIFHLQPAKGNPWLDYLSNKRSTCESMFGKDPSYSFDVHCSLSSFFRCDRDQLTEICQSLSKHVEAFDYSPLSSPSSVSTFAGTPKSSSGRNSPSPRKCLDPPRFVVELDSFCKTNDGYVILTLHAPTIKSMIDSFASTQDIVSIAPKSVSHITLARDRSPQLQSSMLQEYIKDIPTIFLTDAFSDAHVWDLVVLEKKSGTENIKEVARIPLL